MPQLISNFTSALKEVMLPYIQDNYPQETPLLDQFKRDVNQQFINDEWLFPIRNSRHGGVANLANDGNNIVSSSGARTTRGTVSPRRITGAFDISDMVIRASKKGMGAVEADLTFQSETLATDFGRHINRQLYSDGVGVVSQALGSVSGTEISVMYPDANLDDGRSIDWYGTINGDIDPMKYIHADQILGIGTGGAADGTVAAVTGTSIQLTGATASAANDSIYIQDGSGAGAGTSEIQGVRAALSSSTGTSTYAGLARNTNSWTPQFGSSSEALTLSRMERQYLKALEFGKKGDKYAIFMNITLYQKYADTLQAMRRTVNSLELTGGWSGLEFQAGGGKVGVFPDYEVPDGEMIILNLDTWALLQIDEVDWLGDPNSGELLRLQNTTLYQAVLVWYANVVCVAPAANARETRKSD